MFQTLVLLQRTWGMVCYSSIAGFGTVLAFVLVSLNDLFILIEIRFPLFFLTIL